MNLKIFRKITTATAVSVLLITVSASYLYAEVVFLKDGSIIEGMIVSDAASSVTLRTKEKKQNQIPRSDIMRVLYTELKLGKIYVQKRDGKGIVAFMVDEDRESYTFRYDLYRPEEFVLKRSDVLFIAEKNPSGLQVDGEAETDRLPLKWLPPYDEVKKYNVYIKKNDKDKYELADETGGKSITLKKLPSNTKFFIIVTSVDTSGYESPPSNEIQVKTKNIPPEKPAGIKRETVNGKINLRWSESTDPDGKVRGYNIYRFDDETKTKLAAVKNPEYLVPGNVSVYKLEITAEDDLGSESLKVRVSMPMQFVISAAPSALVITGNLGEMFGPGYGGMFNIGFRNFLFQDFEMGLSSGYFTFKGKEKKNTDSMFMIPVTAYAGYHLGIGDWFSFFPFVKGGESYSKVKYTGFAGKIMKAVIDPVAAAGLAMSIEGENMFLSAGADYGFLYESSGMKPFYEGFISFGIKFEL